MENLFAKAWEKFGRLDVVIANAGVINFGNTWELTDEQVEKVINIDLIGTWRTDKYQHCFYQWALRNSKVSYVLYG